MKDIEAIALILELEPQEQPQSCVIGDVYRALNGDLYLGVEDGESVIWENMSEEPIN